VLLNQAKEKEFFDNVLISDYTIQNPILSEVKGKACSEKKLNIELTFLSNDPSVGKYERFMNDFQVFLVESGWQTKKSAAEELITEKTGIRGITIDLTTHDTRQEVAGRK
jgi:hypothetical protein